MLVNLAHPQLQELAEVLQEMGTNYQYVYQPAMYYETEAEGVGVLSRYPILESQYMNLTFVAGKITFFFKCVMVSHSCICIAHRNT